MISYRRDDSGDIAGRIFDRLAGRYGREQVFRDIDAIPLGAQFRAHISQVIANSEIIIAVVGPQWAGPRRRLRPIDDPDDSIRVEIETGLRLRVPIIPILVHDAQMPRPDELPDSIRDFAYRNAARVSEYADFDFDMSRLIRAIDALGDLPGRNPTPLASGPTPFASEFLVPPSLPRGALSIGELIDRRGRADVYPLQRRRAAGAPVPDAAAVATYPEPLAMAAHDKVAIAPVAGTVESSRRSVEPIAQRPSYPQRTRPRKGLKRLLLVGAIVGGAIVFRREIWGLLSFFGDLLHIRGLSALPASSRQIAEQLPAMGLPAMVGVTAGLDADVDTVEVSAFSRERAPAGSQLLVQAFLHLLDKAALVGARARAADPHGVERMTTTLAVELARGKRVDIHLDAGEFEVEEPVQSVVWRGRPSACQFVVTVPPDAKPGVVYLKIQVLLDQTPIGSLRFAFNVTSRADGFDELRLAASVARHYNYVFLSYSSRDRVEALQCAHTLSILGIEYFQDILQLRAGKEFEDAIFAAIDRCDLFLLFWSKSAARSKWVRREAERAYNRRLVSGDDVLDIAPYLLEGPPVPGPIPVFLRHLHFNDFHRYFIAGAKVERAARTGRPAS